MSSQVGPYDLLQQIGDIVPLPSSLPFHCKPGRTVAFYLSCYQLGVLASPTTVTFTLIDPNGNQTVGTVVSASTGNFESDNLIPITATPGAWTARWQTSGQAYEGALEELSFYVDALVGITEVAAVAPPPFCPPVPPAPPTIVRINALNSPYTPLPGQTVVCDTSVGSVVVTLPTLTFGQQVTVTQDPATAFGSPVFVTINGPISAKLAVPPTGTTFAQSITITGPANAGFSYSWYNGASPGGYLLDLS